jgi:hypothetical protein
MKPTSSLNLDSAFAREHTDDMDARKIEYLKSLLAEEARLAARQREVIRIMAEASHYADTLDVEALLKSMNVKWVNG